MKTHIKNIELWQFPIQDYPISIIGNEGACNVLILEVTQILSAIFDDFNPESLRLNASKTGKFYAVKAKLFVKNAEQINQLYTALDKSEHIKTVI